MNPKTILYNLTHPLLRFLRSSRWLIYCIFGVRVPRGVQVNYDPTTIALSHTVKECLRDTDHRIFEMGIGQAALVSLSLPKRKKLSLNGADCSPSRVESSRCVANHNNIPANFILSDMFGDVPKDDRYDLIFFNVPYVPRQQGEALKLTERLGVDGDQVWDGGMDGTEVLSRFLDEALEFLARDGRLVFGVQNIFISDTRVCEVIEQCGWRLLQRSRKPLVPSCCYVLEPAPTQPS